VTLLVIAVSGQCEQQGVQIGSALLAVGSAAVQGWQLEAVLSLIPAGVPAIVVPPYGLK
jgi:hypothetical protein